MKSLIRENDILFPLFVMLFHRGYEEKQQGPVSLTLPTLQCNRQQQKLHKRATKSPELAAFLERIVFLHAIWEFSVLLMPTLNRMFTSAAPFSLPLRTQPSC